VVFAGVLAVPTILDGWGTAIIFSVIISAALTRAAAARELRRARRVAARDLMHNLRALGIMYWEAGHPAATRHHFWSGFAPSTSIFSIYAPVLIGAKKSAAEPLLLIHRWIAFAERNNTLAAQDLDDDDRIALVEALGDLKQMFGLDLTTAEIEDTFTKDYSR